MPPAPPLPPAYDVTVVTVCRNVLPELRKTLPSVLAQKAKGSLRIEHLVIDGASTDGTPAWLEEKKNCGEIDAYITEPDSGIYDAMNKGIARARGRVITFMNAGDTYTEADIACCVRPLLEGCAMSAVGATDYISPDGKLLYCMKPALARAYTNIIGCHQAYFFDTAATRAAGGYDTVAFRSAADLELMNTFLRRHGMPFCTDTVVARFYVGGFSDNCWEKYRHEFIDIQWRSWEQLQQRCRRDARYAEMMTAMLARHCLVLGTGKAALRKGIGHYQELLQQMIDTLPLPNGLCLRRALLRCAHRAAFSRRPHPRLLRVVDFLCAAVQPTPHAPTADIASRRPCLIKVFYRFVRARLSLLPGMTKA